MNNAANDDDIQSGTEYASRVGIQITPPKWGFSKGDYFFNAEKKVIAKGLTSIKYMSKNTAPVLYDLAQKNEYKYFVDLLMDIDRKTRVDSRQLDILIKIDYFSEFGNQRELLCIADLYANTFKRGEAKKLNKEKIDNSPIAPIIKKYSIGMTKAGGVAKSYTILDIVSAMHEVEELVKSSGMEDVETLVKVRNFKDAMGYVGYISHRPEDRRKLYVMTVRPLYRRRDGKQFGYSVVTKSIGSGKQSRFTVFNRVYDKCPFKDDDVILCEGYERDPGDKDYFTLTAYRKIS